MAEAEGFEPPWAMNPNGFQDRLVVTSSICLRILTCKRKCNLRELCENSLLAGKRKKPKVLIFQGFSGERVTKRVVFQDRLVVTASIFLLIYGVVYYTIYKQSYFEVARETRFTNPLRIPHEDASSSLASGERGYPRQRYSCDVVNHRTNY